jgi:hypothetical protein
MPINTQSFGNSQAHSEMNQVGNGSVTNQASENIRLADIQRTLAGATFPANKNDLVEYAVDHHAASYVVNVLQQLQTPEFGSKNDQKLTVYNNLDELMREIQKVE